MIRHGRRVKGGTGTVATPESNARHRNERPEPQVITLTPCGRVGPERPRCTRRLPQWEGTFGVPSGVPTAPAPPPRTPRRRGVSDPRKDGSLGVRTTPWFTSSALPPRRLAPQGPGGLGGSVGDVSSVSSDPRRLRLFGWVRVLRLLWSEGPARRSLGEDRSVALDKRVVY